ncbi:MAG: TIGR04551 family protein [Deltaproteobacteria bacterium]|nr:TIGR04551 family protein [Deltaproteobacteria bacterium]MCB9788162.1 TIGR04551 family protein [Deltaproteobacteria bacterium]
MRRPGALSLVLALIACAGSIPARADDVDDELEKLIEEAGSDSSLGGWADKQAERPPSYPRLEHHGYFRFRADLFWRGHLGTVNPDDRTQHTSAIPAPLRENAINNDPDTPFANQIHSNGAKTIAGANIRFRYQPKFLISSSMRIAATFDILDNLVLGSTPDFDGNLSRPDVPLSAFASSQAPPQSGINGFRDGIRVKEAYAEWQPAFLLRLGRMSSNWGLGMLANGGQGIDSDYGDYVDRAMLLLKIYGVYIAPMWDFAYSGATTEDPGNFFGQAKDLGQADDVKQWVLAIFQRPLSEAERAKRQIELREEFKPAFDWGLYTVFRKQNLDLTQESYRDYLESGGLKTYDYLTLVPRDAWVVVPDLWLRFEKRFDYTSGIRFELEAAGLIGEIGNVSDDASTDGSNRKIRQLGVAMELEYQRGQISMGLDAGMASGDSAEGFGVNDRPVLAEADGSPNRNVTAFKFDRDYHIDLLLFREVIGTVTNTVYVKPYVSYDVFDSVEEALGARLDLLVAEALAPSATPGDKRHLGVEADLRLFYEEKGVFNLDIESGFLFPGKAFDLLDQNGDRLRSAKFAFTVQTRLTMQF